jgi:hypothetical protein
LSPLLLRSDALLVGVAGDQAVVNIAEYKQVDSVSYTALLLWEAKELLSQINSVDVLPPYFFCTHFTYHPPIIPRFSNWFCPSGFPTKTMNTFFLSPMCTMF